jgi:hypothetical protein
VHAGQLPRSVRRYVESNTHALARVPVGYFVVCYAMIAGTLHKRTQPTGHIDALRNAAPRFEPVAVGLRGAPS